MLTALLLFVLFHQSPTFFYFLLKTPTFLLLSETESKLSYAIKKGDMDRVSVAHGLIEVAET